MATNSRAMTAVLFMFMTPDLLATLGGGKCSLHRLHRARPLPGAKSLKTKGKWKGRTPVCGSGSWWRGRCGPEFGTGGSAPSGQPSLVGHRRQLNVVLEFPRPRPSSPRPSSPAPSQPPSPGEEGGQCETASHAFPLSRGGRGG